MLTSVITLSLLLCAAGDDKAPERKPHPLAPSLPLLTAEEEKKLDEIIDRFILYDTGQLTGAAGHKALRDFEALGPDAIPALLRGLNRSAVIAHSCPVAVIARKLNRMLAASQDPKLLDFARQEIGAGVMRTPHSSMLQDLRVAVMLRKNALARAGNTGATPPKPSPASMSELVEAAGKERGPRLRQVLLELGQRGGDEALGAIAGVAASDYDRDGQQLARQLLATVVAKEPADAIRKKLKDDKAEVRLAAIRAAGSRNLALGGEFIDLLSDDDAGVRDLARQALVALARGQDFGPRPGAGKTEQEQAVQRWRQWWSRQTGR